MNNVDSVFHNDEYGNLESNDTGFTLCDLYYYRYEEGGIVDCYCDKECPCFDKCAVQGSAFDGFPIC